MKCWHATQYNLQSLRPVELPVPEPGNYQILIRVHAVSLNYRDKYLLEGRFGTHFPLPFVPASDAAGTVVSIGKKVQRVRVGDRVTTHFYPMWQRGTIRTEQESQNLGVPLAGVLSEYVLMDEQGVVRTPGYLTDEEASTLPVAAVTAWSALFEKSYLQPGDSVLIQGTGGVALFGLQLAKVAGASVIVISSSDAKLEKAKALGADYGINYTQQPDWQNSVLALTDGRGVDHVVEVVGGENVRKSVTALARGGNIVMVGFLQDGSFCLEILPLMLKLATIRTVGVGPRDSFEVLNRALVASKLHPVISDTYSFRDVPEAFEQLDKGPFGKIVVRL